MRRREFLSVIGGAAAAWPVVARAQRSIPAVGMLGLFPLDTAISLQRRALKQGLEELGFVENQSVLFEARWTQGAIGSQIASPRETA